jgi:hypothetical protein
MKKLLLLSFVLFSFSSFGQIEQLSEPQSKVLSLFKTEIVEKTFKDPYSFKLLKLEITPQTKGDRLLEDIKFIESNLTEYRKYDKYAKPEDKVDIRLDALKKQYAEMSDGDKQTLKCYSVRLDCYGNNSLGNQTLGRYKLYVNTDYSGQYNTLNGTLSVSKL